YTTALGRDSAFIHLTGAFASLILRDGKGLHLEAGGRWNRHSRFGDHATFTFNPSYAWDGGWQLFFNASSAFKAPSLYQLYDASVGLRSLRPETSLTTEAGLRYAPAAGIFSARAVLFAREIRNGIDFDTASAPPALRSRPPSGRVAGTSPRTTLSCQEKSTPSGTGTTRAASPMCRKATLRTTTSFGVRATA
ncbi:MAG: TonB-dependent receptor, partial [Chitinophagia bacterium]|nr:TonB-dependent receptor [Chitinophagia bacterium]